MRTLALTLTGIAFASSAAFATNAQISNAAAVIDTLDVATVGGMIAELGEENVKSTEKDNERSVAFVDEGQPYTAVVTLCDFKPGKCLALVQVTMLNMGSTKLTADQIVKIGSDNIFLTVFKPEEDNTIAFARVLMIDGGVTRQNLAINIENFVDTSRSTIRTLASKLTSSNQQPGMPMSASNNQLRPVQPDEHAVQAIQTQLLAKYREMLTSRARH